MLACLACLTLIWTTPAPPYVQQVARIDHKLRVKTSIRGGSLELWSGDLARLIYPTDGTRWSFPRFASRAELDSYIGSKLPTATRLNSAAVVGDEVELKLPSSVGGDYSLLWFSQSLEDGSVFINDVVKVTLVVNRGPPYEFEQSPKLTARSSSLSLGWICLTVLVLALAAMLWLIRRNKARNSQPTEA